MKQTILILGGTWEARQIAAALSIRPSLEVISSLAGRTDDPILPVGTVRTGGFGGVEGLAHFIRLQRIDLLIIASHPFATRIQANGIRAAEQTGIPVLWLRRPLWQPEDGDRWIFANDLNDAAEKAASLGQRHFLTVGRFSLTAFRGRSDQYYLIRTVAPLLPMDMLCHYSNVVGRGPFSISHELSLFLSYRLETLITKNGGGSASVAKLHAARQLGLPVIILQPKIVDSLSSSGNLSIHSSIEGLLSYKSININ